jgi:hypothetical protein
MAINNWTQTRVERMRSKATVAIETIGAGVFVEYLQKEGYGAGGNVQEILADIPSGPFGCECEGCTEKRMERIQRSGIFVTCRGCLHVPIPRNRESGLCAVCEALYGHQ